jgi:hypothetical protein
VNVAQSIAYENARRTIEDYIMTRNNVEIVKKNIEKKRTFFLTMIYKSDIMVLQRKEKQ